MDMDPLNPYEYPCGYNIGGLQPTFHHDLKMGHNYNPNAYHYTHNPLIPNPGINQPLPDNSLQNKSINKSFITNNKEIISNNYVDQASDTMINKDTCNINLNNTGISNTNTVSNNEIVSGLANSSNSVASDLPSNSTVNNIEKTTIETEKEDSKEDLKPLLKRKKTKGRVSSYWNKKVEDKEFAFYGCTICNISFKTIPELDNHVTVHKGRLTSYDLRLKNQKKKKLLKKQQKQMKKLGKKLKKENVKKEFCIDIKPEEGYIGSEVASEYAKNTENNAESTQNSENKSASTQNTSDVQNNNKEENSSKSKKKERDVEANDPRLEKLFKCFACQKQFALSYYLKLHVRSHTDERPYSCNECGMTFITASKRGRHIKRIHLSIRHTCRICYRHFTRFEYLTRHFDKKHADDKIEGEPYDYNVILPYLKELEEQLRDKKEKSEESKTENKTWNAPTVQPVEEQKTKHKDKIKFEDEKAGATSTVSEELIVEVKQEPLDDEELEPLKEEEVFCEFVCKDERQEDDEKIDNTSILVESVKPARDNHGNGLDGCDDSHKMDVDDGGGRDDNDYLSDDDYFPSNTWAATPKVEHFDSEASKPKKKKPGRKSGGYPKQCDLCDQMLKNKYFMKMHMTTHADTKPYTCDTCQKGFLTKSKLCRHLKAHEIGEEEVKTEKEDLEGDENCDRKKKKAKRLKKSKKRLKKLISSSSSPVKEVEGFIKRGDFSKRPYVCMYCHQRFLHRDTMIMHRKTHKNDSFKCYYCLESLPDAQSVTSHEQTHAGPRPYVCTECGRAYSRREVMLTHRKTHDPSQEGKVKKEFICDICPKSYNAACKLQRHLLTHSTEKFVLKYECPVCAYMFNTKYHIEMHLTTHMKEGLILEENRSSVLAMVLQNARKFPKSGDAAVSLSDRVPADERSRVCNICGQVFQHFYYLEEHLKSHGSKIAIADENTTEEKKHICPVCNKGFKLHYYLKLHSFTHSKEKPFICQQCGKGFITKGKLKRHLETHTGLKKYQCHICCKFFTRPSYLRVHIRTIHATQDYNFRLK